MNKDIYFTDTHLHPLMIKNFLENKNDTKIDINDMIKEFQSKYVKKMIFVGTETRDVSDHMLLCKTFSDCFFSAGIHPCDVKSNCLKDFFNALDKAFVESKGKLIALGEIGLDFYHKNDAETKKLQFVYFYEQINYAALFNLPIIIHSRSALPETYDVLKQYSSTNIQGVVHCFNDDKEIAKKFIDLGYALGIGAYITYPKNKNLLEVIKFFNFEHFVYETDAPFLPLQKERGSINTPHAIPVVNEFIANACNIDPIQLAQTVEKTVFNIFKI